MNFNKYKLLFTVLLFFITPLFVLALEGTYPNFPGAPFIGPNATLPDLISYFFTVGIYFSGAIALISLAIAGVQLIIGQANPEGVNSAKDRIRGSLLGMVLLMVSYLILKSINPVLITPTITPLDDAPGIFYIGIDKQVTAQSAEANTDNPIKAGFIDIKYRCATPNDPTLLIWAYKEVNFGNSSGDAKTYEIACEETKPLSDFKSFKMAFKTAGVYFYKNAGCASDGYRSNVILTSGQIPEDFKGSGGSMQLVNNANNNTYYGAIIHEKIDEASGGLCQQPLLANNIGNKTTIDGGCKPITIAASSATIFLINDKPLTSGNGIDFYSGAYGWDAGSRAGIYQILKNAFTSFMLVKDPASMKFTYNIADTTLAERTANPNFKKSSDTSSGSIRINGSYIVTLYSDNGNSYCQTFKKNVVDMKGTEYTSPVGAGDDGIKWVNMITIK